MTPEKPEVKRLEALFESEDYDPREPTPMELAQIHREYCASQGVWLLSEEKMLEFAKHGDESHGC